MGGTPVEIIETERKYEVGARFTVPGLAGLPGVSEVAAPQRYRLTAVYFDTADLALAKARITLRRRSGGSDAGWHLKLPAGAATRREVHAPLGRGRATVPPRLLEMVSRWLGGQPVRPIARLQTSRTVRRLMGSSGRVLAEIADDRVRGSVPDAAVPGAASLAGAAGPANGGWRTAASWREVEVELVDGGHDLLDAAGGRLSAAGARLSDAPSKLSLVLAAAGALPGPVRGG